MQQMRMDKNGVVLGWQFERVNKTWGWEQILVETNQYALKHLVMFAGQHCSMHWHERKHETITVCEGILEIEFENFPRVTLVCGMSLAIPAGREFAHRMHSTGAVDCHYVESSGSGHRGDAIRVS